MAAIKKQPIKSVFKDTIKQLTPSLSMLEKPSVPARRLSHNLKKVETSSLQSLTKAALLLPGLLSAPVHAAEGDEVDFQYGHYQESNRSIYGLVPDPSTGNFNVTSLPSGLKPIEVDSIHGSAKVALTDRVKFAFNYLQDTWSGATPIASAPAAFGVNLPRYADPTVINVAGASPYLQPSNNPYGPDAVDAKGNPMIAISDPNLGLVYQQNNQMTDVLVSASPEVRNQGDVKLAYEWDQASLSVGGGVSTERDYESRFGNIGGLWSFNQKRTTMNLGSSYTNSDTHAVLPHDSFSYIHSDAYQLNGQVKVDEARSNALLLSGNRQDWGATLGLSQVINKDALISTDVSYTRSTGYLANPYKAVSILFIDPSYPDFYRLPTGVFAGRLHTLSEQRPNERNQVNMGGRYVQFINPLDAALHFDYHFSIDDWGVQAHAFETDWVQPIANNWTVTPRVRYYSQDAASFYTPWFTTQQAYSKLVSTENGISTTPYDPGKLRKQFAKGLSLETGFEYYTHQGSLKIGGGGENNFNNFDSWNVNAALKLNLDTLSLHLSPDNGHTGHDHQHGVHAPAGVMYDHMLPQAGDMMVDYRYMYNNQSGNTLHGTSPAIDSEIIANGCGPNPCYIRSGSMSMNMHMLDLMYAPTDWLTLMLMPQFVSMSMTMNALDGAPSSSEQEMIRHHLQSGHQTGGIGDLGMYGLFKLFDNGIHHIHATAGFNAPTGEVGIKLNTNHGITGGYIDYGMQLGSGTWDFKPSLTYTGQWQQFSWGAQSSGTLRMENQNQVGYALGDQFQSTAWSSYHLTHWLSASVRGLFTS
ncbi:MAG: DUF3570 domain-containing protein, partial [Methylobacter sp.]|nr:DUF3570 domain-containing protein [Methylobacter sp.]